MWISFVEPIKQSACSSEGIFIALYQIACCNSQPNEQSIVIIAADGEYYLPVLFVVAHGFSGSTVTLASKYDNHAWKGSTPFCIAKFQSSTNEANFSRAR